MKYTLFYTAIHATLHAKIHEKEKDGKRIKTVFSSFQQPAHDTDAKVSQIGARKK